MSATMMFLDFKKAITALNHLPLPQKKSQVSSWGFVRIDAQEGQVKLSMFGIEMDALIFVDAQVSTTFSACVRLSDIVKWCKKGRDQKEKKMPITMTFDGCNIKIGNTSFATIDSDLVFVVEEIPDRLIASFDESADLQNVINRTVGMTSTSDMYYKSYDVHYWTVGVNWMKTSGTNGYRSGETTTRWPNSEILPPLWASLDKTHIAVPGKTSKAIAEILGEMKCESTTIHYGTTTNNSAPVLVVKTSSVIILSETKPWKDIPFNNVLDVGNENQTQVVVDVATMTQFLKAMIPLLSISNTLRIEVIGCELVLSTVVSEVGEIQSRIPLTNYHQAARASVYWKDFKEVINFGAGEVKMVLRHEPAPLIVLDSSLKYSFVAVASQEAWIAAPASAMSS